MKKQIKSLLSVSLVTLMVISSTSCSSTDDQNQNSSFILNANDLKGNITTEVTLTSSKIWTLTGELIVKNGGSLIIEPGTKIVASGVTYIAVEQGGKIFVNGTASQPVVMTSLIATPGAWGGLVICGKAPINKATTASAEVSGLTYGGTDVNDSSGSIKYLRIEYSGYAYNAEKEFNGLSLFGVGKGTVLEYIQVHEGADDGFEFFGGTVNAKYLVSTSNEDDQFDWTEGWNGTGDYWFAKKGLGRGNRGIEADNNANNRLATPISAPTLNNITLIGLGSADTGAENQALKLREGTYGLFNNILIKDFAKAFDVQHDETLNAVGTSLKITNVRFEGVTTEASYKDTAGNSLTLSGFYTVNNSATGAGNGFSTPSWAQGWTVGL